MAFAATAHEPYHVGVGTWVKDTTAPTWTIDTASPGDGAWKDVTFPWLVAAELVTGTMGGAGSVVEISIQQADDSSGTNEEIIAAFPAFTLTDDDTTYVVPCEITKRYVQVVTVTPTASTGTCVVTLRDFDYHRADRPVSV
jgi:hypothetical protein